MTRRSVTFLSALALAGAAPLFLHAQSPRPASPARADGVPIATEFNGLHFRSIGPAVMSGRVSAFAVYEKHPAIFYVAAAHGGLWKTMNNGVTFTAEFQHDGLMSIGDGRDQSVEPGPRVAGHRRGQQPAEHVVGRRRLQIDRRRRRRSPTWAWRTRTTSTASRSTRSTTTSCSWPRRAASSARAATAACTRPPTAGATWRQVLKVDENTGANEIADGPDEPSDPLRVDLPAAAVAVLLQRRRPWQRDVEVDRRRRDLDAAHQGPPRGPARPHRPRHLPQQSRTSSTRRSRRRPPDAAVAALRQAQGRPLRQAQAKALRQAQGRREDGEVRVRRATPASIDRTMPVPRGARSAATTRGRCTSARSASTRTIPTACSWATSGSSSRPTAARRSGAPTRPSTTTRTASGSIRTIPTTS